MWLFVSDVILLSPYCLRRFQRTGPREFISLVTVLKTLPVFHQTSCSWLGCLRLSLAFRYGWVIFDDVKPRNWLRNMQLSDIVGVCSFYAAVSCQSQTHSFFLGPCAWIIVAEIYPVNNLTHWPFIELKLLSSWVSVAKECPLRHLRIGYVFDTVLGV